jgi:hypothetical protein
MMITARDRLALMGAALALGMGAGNVAKSETPAGADKPGAELPEGWADLCASLGKAAEYVQAHPYYADPQNRASGFAMITAVLIAALETQVIHDPDFPIFHVHDSRLLSGADNPDQRYLSCRIRGGETYRIWGRIRTERRLDAQVYAGAPTKSAPGRSASFLSFEEMRLESDGSFEITLSPERSGKNWIENPADGIRVLIRQIYSDWSVEAPGEVHIDRVGYEGALRPAVSEADLSRRFRTAGEKVLEDVEAWSTLHQMMIGQPDVMTPVNRIPPMVDTFAQGGAKGRYMTFTIFELEPDEALIFRMWPTGATYQAVHLRDMWNASLEYSNRQTSLTTDQAWLDPDGSYWMVVGGRDPGIQNWVDTVGLTRGRLACRYDGIGGKPFDPAKTPTVLKVRYDELEARLPAGTPGFTPADRAAAIAARRRHLQERCHH